MHPTVALTVATLKIFFRNRQAVFFNFLVPLVIMAIFGVLNFDAFARVDVGVVDEARNSATEELVHFLEDTDVLDLQIGTREDQIEALGDGDLDFLIILPPGFGASGGPSKVDGLFNANKPQEAQVAATVLSRALDDLTFEVTGTDRLFQLESREVSSRDFDYVDFLVPGIIAMSIMQLGLFSVTFAIVQYRQQGILRRLRAAPINPGHFLAAQIVTRLVVSVIQTLILLGAGVLFLGIDVRGNLLNLLLLAVVGGGLFVTMGYVISGFAKSEESAAPIANLVSLPMLFLSGVFFSRDNLPGVLETLTDFFPLTYLADGMRQVTADGAGLAQISGDLLGLGIWLIVAFFVATRVFRWE